jgi:hypothetical protein
MHQWGPNRSKVDVDNFFLFYEISIKFWIIHVAHSQNFHLKFETLWITISNHYVLQHLRCGLFVISEL